VPEADDLTLGCLSLPAISASIATPPAVDDAEKSPLIRSRVSLGFIIPAVIVRLYDAA
jgi:hypothetical protein